MIQLSNKTFYGYAVAMVLALGLGLGLLSGCSSTDSASSDPTVTMSTSSASRVVSSMGSHTPIILGNGLTCDSVVVTRARILISNLKLHHDDEDTVGKGTIKVGPFIAEFDSSGEKIVSTVTVPAGSYDKIKFEMHKLDDKTDALYINDPLFGDFINGGRYTVIIDGRAYVNGTGYAFRYTSSKTENVEIKLNQVLTFSSGNSYNLALIFDPVLVFGQTGKAPWDPRDPDNHDKLEGLIKTALKSLKK